MDQIEPRIRRAWQFEAFANGFDARQQSTATIDAGEAKGRCRSACRGGEFRDESLGVATDDSAFVIGFGW
mgnify:FL=1